MRNSSTLSGTRHHSVTFRDARNAILPRHRKPRHRRSRLPTSGKLSFRHATQRSRPASRHDVHLHRICSRPGIRRWKRFRRDAAALIADSPAIVLVDGLWFSLSPPALCLPPAHPPHMHRQGASVFPSSSTSNRWHLSSRRWHRPPEILQVPKLAELGRLAEQLARGTERDTDRASREAAARQPLTMAPVSGTLTSN